jgi:hypothetical protein
LSYRLPDPRLEMPELLVPGRRPMGEVEIDWQNSMTFGLSGFWLLPNLKDLVTGRVAIVNGSPTYYPDRINFNGSSEIDTGPYSQSLNYFTIIAEFDVTGSVTTTQMIMCTSGSQAAAIQYLNTNTPRVRAANKLVSGSSNNGRLTVAGRYNTDINTAQIYQNGSLAGSIANATTNPTSGNLFIGSQNGLNYFSGDVYYCMIYNRYLGADEIVDLYRNPYQFLIPA